MTVGINEDLTQTKTRESSKLIKETKSNELSDTILKRENL